MRQLFDFASGGAVWRPATAAIIFVLLLVGCQRSEPELVATAVPATATAPAIQTPETSRGSDFIVIATDAPNSYFADDVA